MSAEAETAASRPELERGRRTAWTIYGLLAAALLLYLATLLARRPDSYSRLLDGWSIAGFELVASILCLARGVLRPRGRAATLALGFALLGWAIGDGVMSAETHTGVTPALSLADVFYLAFYPLAYVALVLSLRGEARRLTTPSWLDGLIAGFGAASLCAAFAFRGILRSTGGNVEATVANLAYPIGDLLLFGLAVGGTALLAGRRKTPWFLLAAGTGLNAIGDTSNLFQHGFGSSPTGAVVNAIAWPAASLLMSMAVWVRPRPSNPLTLQRSTGLVLPELAGATALGVLLFGSFHYESRVALGLAIATLVTVGLRLALSARSLRTLSHERRHQSVTDELTGLGNRRHLFHALEAYFADQAEAPSGSGPLVFLFVDLNHFKEINDSFGHQAGDELLRQLGPRLGQAIGDSDLAVRLGGDEFAVLLVGRDTQYTRAVASRLTARIKEPFRLGSVSAAISASIGIAEAPTDASDPAGLMACADVAMYRAKLSDAPFAIYKEDLDHRGSRLGLAADLREAVETRQLVLHYQPQLDLRSGEVTAVEALVRWQHPRLGLVAPLNFLPLAEEAGLMRPITTFVLDEALAQCAAWEMAGTPVTVSVNVSATNLLEPGFTDLIASRLAHRGLDGRRLVLEITETSVISEFEKSRQVIEALCGLGLTVSIDDFGAGFTSLAYLNTLSVGELKLDRTFISSLGLYERERNGKLVRATIDLGHTLGLRVVGEGVEDRVTLDLLAEFGCDRAQGQFIGRPRPAAELRLRAPRRQRLTLASGSAAAGGEQLAVAQVP